MARVIGILACNNSCVCTTRLMAQVLHPAGFGMPLKEEALRAALPSPSSSNRPRLRLHKIPCMEGGEGARFVGIVAQFYQATHAVNFHLRLESLNLLEPAGDGVRLPPARRQKNQGVEHLIVQTGR